MEDGYVTTHLYNIYMQQPPLFPPHQPPSRNDPTQKNLETALSLSNPPPRNLTLARPKEKHQIKKTQAIQKRPAYPSKRRTKKPYLGWPIFLPLLGTGDPHSMSNLNRKQKKFDHCDRKNKTKASSTSLLRPPLSSLQLHLVAPNTRKPTQNTQLCEIHSRIKQDHLTHSLQSGKKKENDSCEKLICLRLELIFIEQCILLALPLSYLFLR